MLMPSALRLPSAPVRFRRSLPARSTRCILAHRNSSSASCAAAVTSDSLEEALARLLIPGSRSWDCWPVLQHNLHGCDLTGVQITRSITAMTLLLA